MSASDPVIVPSFVAKVTRAKKHLIDLQSEVERWESAKPYTVRESIEGKPKRTVRRVAFTSNPANTDIPIIAADAIYDLRSALDHLMSAMVSNKDRGSAMFPIFFQGVWEAIVPGENEQRVKDRARWASVIKTLPREAVAILKAMQPPDDAEGLDTANLLRVINRLSNQDRHVKLPVFATGLQAVMVCWTLPDGTPQTGIGAPKADAGFFKDHAKLEIPDGAMDVKIAGTPLITVRVGQDKRGVDRYLEIPKELWATVRLLENEVFPALQPHVLR